MTTLSKILLTVAAAGLVCGSVIAYCGVGGAPALAAVLPIGAVAFGAFLIVFMLEKEVAKYDEEQAAKWPQSGQDAAPPDVAHDSAPGTSAIQLEERTL